MNTDRPAKYPQRADETTIMRAAAAGAEKPINSKPVNDILPTPSPHSPATKLISGLVAAYCCFCVCLAGTESATGQGGLCTWRKGAPQ